MWAVQHKLYNVYLNRQKNNYIFLLFWYPWPSFNLPPNPRWTATPPADPPPPNTTASAPTPWCGRRSMRASARCSRCWTATATWSMRWTRINTRGSATTWSRTCPSFRSSTATSPRSSLSTPTSTPISPPPSRTTTPPPTSPLTNRDTARDFTRSVIRSRFEFWSALLCVRFGIFVPFFQASFCYNVREEHYIV